MTNDKLRYRELADFLKNPPAKDPSFPKVGLPESSRRRTPGLRREEVGQLAGIGVTWYTWLEQGRPIHVSGQVLESLSHVFSSGQKRTGTSLFAGKPASSGRDYWLLRGW